MSASAARVPDERGCPRVVGATDDGKGLVTCGEQIPCPYHGMPLFVVGNDIASTDDGGEGSE